MTFSVLDIGIFPQLVVTPFYRARKKYISTLYKKRETEKKYIYKNSLLTAY
jgi:hypothetical protein